MRCNSIAFIDDRTESQNCSNGGNALDGFDWIPPKRASVAEFSSLLGFNCV